jgi:hypothetical protein
MGTRRILDEEETHPTADRPHAARSGRRAGRRSLGPRDRKEARHQRGDLSSLEEPLGGMKTDAIEALEGAGVRERPPKEDRCRAGGGHKHPEGGEPGKLPSIRPGEGRPSSTFDGSLRSPSVGRVVRSVNPGRASATPRAAARRSEDAGWSNGWSGSRERTPLWLQEGVDDAEARGLASEQEAGASVVEGGGLEGAPGAAKKAASPGALARTGARVDQPSTRTTSGPTTS